MRLKANYGKIEKIEDAIDRIDDSLQQIRKLRR